MGSLRVHDEARWDRNASCAMFYVTTARMNKLTQLLSLRRGAVLAVSLTVSLTMAVGALTACGTNTNYVDLMRVTDETELTITTCDATYRDGTKLSDRVHAWNEIKELREKQMIMAQRIRVASMPEVVAKTMTVAEGNAKKAELVTAAKARYQEARALPRPTQASMTAK